MAELKPQQSISIRRVFVKTLLVLILINLCYLLTQPFDFIQRHISVYNLIIPGRERLPYGERPELSYSVSISHIPAMLASHQVRQAKPEDEYRVLIFGDSSVWGWRLTVEETLSARLNDLALQTSTGRHVRFYNLAYPQFSASKDVLLLDAVHQYDADAYIWLLTLQALIPETRYDSAFFQSNQPALGALIAQSYLLPRSIQPQAPGLFDRSLPGQREDLAAWLQLQTYGFAWAATGTDQWIPEEFEPVRRDLEPTEAWHTFQEATTLTEADISLQLIDSFATLTSDKPLLIINAPVFISDGQSSELRYNTLYPRWAFDQYRDIMARYAQNQRWHYRDLWDAIAPTMFTDNPVHLSPDGTDMLARILAPTLTAAIQPESEQQ